MKVGTENKKQLYTAGALGFVALLALYPLYNTFFGESGAPRPQPAPVIHDVTVGGAGKTVASASNKAVSAPPGFVVGGGPDALNLGKAGATLDPTLHMDAMLVTESLRYSGSGRNIFGGASVVAAPSAKITKAKFEVRPPAAVAAPPIYSGPPPKPPINLKFFGTETNTATGVRRAFLLNGDDVFLAYAGDVVQRRYRVISISQNSIQIEDIPNDNRQTLPLVN